MKKMKKIIGILGVVAFAMAMFFSTNTTNALKGDFDLASLLNVSNANAECNDATFNAYCYSGSSCILICGGVTSTGRGYSNTQ